MLEHQSTDSFDQDPLVLTGSPADRTHQNLGECMSMIITFLYLLVGILAGVFSGLIGIGGGVIIVPLLVFIFKFSQHQAQGTTLALMVPPIGLLAAATYYKQGYVDLKVAALVAAGFFVGGLLGAKYAVGLSNATLEKTFGITLILIGLRMILK
jgi:uncharacterized membrane protein YfcA